MTRGGWILAALLLTASAPLAVAETGELYVPQLGDLMDAAQTRHLKRYLAGKVQNWDLAAYDLERLRASLAQAAVLYGGIPVTNVTTAEPLQAVEDAIRGKDGHRFASTVALLTDRCNACHQSMKRSFIVIRLPAGEPFGNQCFSRRNQQINRRRKRMPSR